MEKEFNFEKTKAQNLRRAKKIIRTAHFQNIYILKCVDWKQNRAVILTELENLEFPVIIRSSAVNEDTENASNAGAYLSKLDIYQDGIEESISEVIGSYGEWDDENEVLIQPMLKNVIASGVIFSHDPKTGSPYKVFNWQDGEDTTAVTSGFGGKIFYCVTNHYSNVPSRLSKTIPLLQEIDEVLNNVPYDIEFAVTGDNELVTLLQIRPLIVEAKVIEKKCLEKNISSIHEKLKKSMVKHPFVLGDRTIFGSMPDWNPAEIIGVKPRPLSLSLYRELITDNIWAYQRSNYGYRNLRSFPLLNCFFNIPMVDVRVSFNSFIPSSIDDVLANKLANFYLAYLENNPLLHDKIEFDVVFSCISFDHEERSKILNNHGFSKLEIDRLTDALTNLTKNVIDPKNGLWLKDAAKIQTLSERREILLESQISNFEKIYWLLEDTKRYGTLPFAGLARAGFIGIQFLKSLVTTELISPNDYQDFLNSLSTISNDFKNDYQSINKTDFLKKYGHLRPGTYDILSDRYDEKFDHYFTDYQFDEAVSKKNVSRTTNFSHPNIDNHLEKLDLNIDSSSFFHFIKSSIEQRENSKFEFTKNVSETLKLLQIIGEENGFTNEDMSYLDISVLRNNHPCETDLIRLVDESIIFGKSIHETSRGIKLPPLISTPNDVWGFELPQSIPNFITNKKVSGEITKELTPEAVKERIVLIPNADPGFDWLFSHNIIGFITAWGGPNSHMAIRAGELNIPAIIGCGELLFEQWSTCELLEIDCQIGQVVIIK